MVTIKIPEVALTKAGIGSGYFKCTLAKIKNAKCRKQCRIYTENFPKIKTSGFGVCIFGEGEERNHAFYGIMKALFAQRQAIQIISVGEITSAYFNDHAFYQACSTVDVLGITELGVDESTLNRGSKQAVYDLFRKRADSSKPCVVATNLEIEFPDNCVDMLFPGLGNLLIANTMLVNLSDRSDCEWLRKGHNISSKIIGEV